ncbi:MAG TPA: hypothetical protein VFF74_08280 [Methylophilaceae bacterium]|nr:hypothetical protein [Methylophilaceae bacterium]
MSASETESFKVAVTAALDGEWDRAHMIVQESGAQVACWIHAVLHKIEQDESNSRYWYSRASKDYEAFSDPQAELKAIAEYLAHQ